MGTGPWSCCSWRSPSRSAPPLHSPAPTASPTRHGRLRPGRVRRVDLAARPRGRTLPVSVAYAVWAGLGTAAIAVVGVLPSASQWDIIKAVALWADRRRRRRTQPSRGPLTVTCQGPLVRVRSAHPDLKRERTSAWPSPVLRADRTESTASSSMVCAARPSAPSSRLRRIGESYLLEEPHLAVGSRSLKARRCRGSRPNEASSPATLAITSPSASKCLDPSAGAPTRSSPAGRAAPR